MEKKKIVENSNTAFWTTREISSFLNEEYRDYSLHCAMERCTPSLIDGFKLTQRKVIHSAFKGACKSGNLVKLLNLTGDTLKETLYAHGDQSLNFSIIGLGQEFIQPLTGVIFTYGKFLHTVVPVFSSKWRLICSVNSKAAL